MYHYEYLNDTEFLQELTKSKIKLVNSNGSTVKNVKTKYKTSILLK